MDDDLLARFVTDCKRAAAPEIPADRTIALAALIQQPFFNAQIYGALRARLMSAVRNLALAAEAARGQPLADAICNTIAMLGGIIESAGETPPAEPEISYRPGVD